MSGLIVPRGPFTDLELLVRFARQRAEVGIYDGRPTILTQALIGHCRHFYRVNPEVTACVLYTRDSGHHSSGWWKSPDYERCRHLSLSFAAGAGTIPLPHDRAASREIALAFFGDDTRLAWVEGPYSPEGKSRDVWHYRLFCDPSWAPILPKGEVYSKANTPADWRSFSEIHGALPEPEGAPWLLAGGKP